METTSLLKKLNEGNANTLMETLGIQYTQYQDEVLYATLDVGPKVHQPYGLLHGGATAALAETVGSILSALVIDTSQQAAVGMNLNIYHLNAARSGTVEAKAFFIRKGKSTHVIQIDVNTPDNKRIAYAVLTTKILSKIPTREAK